MRKVTEMSLHRNKDKREAVYDAFEHEQGQEEERRKRVEKEDGDNLSRVGPTARVQNRSVLAPAWLDKMEAEAEDMELQESYVDSDGEAETTKKSFGKNGQVLTDNKHVTETEVQPEKMRLSIAERKKLKKKGLSGRAIGAEAVKRANQREYKKANAVTTSASRGEVGGESGKFKDPRFYMGYGVEKGDRESFAEEALQPNSGLRSAEAQQAAMMESAMLDVAPDEALAMNKQRRIMRWDAKKRKFVKQSLAEIAEIKGKGKRSRNELTSGSVGKSKVPQGEMYAKWSKRTRREVNSDAVAAGDDPDADRPIPNFKINQDAKDELLDEQQLRKKHKERENLKMKNLPKAKRKAIEGVQRKKKNDQLKSASNITHKAARKNVKIVMR
jgi:hypothetical protein